MQPQSKVNVSIIATLSSGFRSAFQQADKSMADLGRRTTALNTAVSNVQGFKRQQESALAAGEAWKAAKRRADELRASIAAQATAGDGGLSAAKDAAKAAAKAYKEARDQVVILNDACKQAGKASAEQKAALNAAKDASKAAGKAARDASKDVDALARAQKQSEAAAGRNKAELARAETTARRLGAAFTEARARLGDMGRELQRNGVNVANLSKEYRRLKVDAAAAQAKQDQAEASLKRQQKIVAAMAGGWKKIQSGIVGVAAAGAVLKAPVAKAIDFDERLARLAATAGGGKDTAGKQALKTEMSNTIESARQSSGGASRDDILTALNSLISSGKFEQPEIPSVLKQVARTSFASGAAPDEVAKMAVSMKQFGIKDLQAGFDAALRAGQVGSFELKDMAQWLPEQLAKGKAAGYGGMEGLKEILSLNQASMLTAGRADQAGNNLVNLLQKMSSREFSDSVGKGVTVKAGDPTTKDGKKSEFDWTTYAQRQRAKGINTIDAFGALLERELAGNKQYQKLKAKAAKLPEGDAKKETLSSMMDIAQGSGLGKIMRDMQASSMMLAYLQGGETLKNVRTALETSKGATEADAIFMQQQVFAKKNIAAGNLDRANETAFDAGSPAIGKALDGFNSITEAFPKTTAAAYGLTGALVAATAAAGAAGIFGMITKGRAAAGAAAAGTAAAGALGTGTAVAGGAATAAGAGALAAKAGIFTRMMAGAKTLLKGGAIAAAGGYVTDAAAGKLGAGGNQINEAQDQKNWEQATALEKVQTAIPRTIETVGSLLFLDNIVNSAKAKRIEEETAFLAARNFNPAESQISKPSAPMIAPVPQIAAPGAPVVNVAPGAPMIAPAPRVNIQAPPIQPSAAADNGASAAAAGAAGLMLPANGAGMLASASKLLKGGLIASAGGYVVDGAAGKLGAGGNKIDAAQDDKNWNRASVWEKMQSALPRGIEKLGSVLFLDNIVNSAKASRVKSETEYLDKKEAKPDNTTAKEALRVATEATTIAANRPNITMSNSYNITITAPAATDAKTLAPELQRELERMERKRQADLRAGYFSAPKY